MKFISIITLYATANAARLGEGDTPKPVDKVETEIIENLSKGKHVTWWDRSSRRNAYKPKEAMGEEESMMSMPPEKVWGRAAEYEAVA